MLRNAVRTSKVRGLG